MIPAYGTWQLDPWGRIGDRRSVEPLIQALKDRDRNVKKGAAVALGEIGDGRAWSP